MDAQHDLYRIGSAASLTGIAVERLRAWERRYGLSPAHREGRTRYYSGEQLERLRRIKQLIDQGQPISSLARLTNEQLGARQTESLAIAPPLPRVGVIGPNLSVLAHQRGKDSQLALAAQWANMVAFTAAARLPKLDAIVVQLPTLTTQSIEVIREKLGNAQIVVVYHFAAEKYLRRAAQANVEILRWPVTWPEIEQACTPASGRPLKADGMAERRFSDAELIAIAAGSTDPSHCPKHLVELISQLNAFADYTADCGGADDATVANAVLYRQAQREATHARARLEEALEAFHRP
ncbi:MAG: MerR family transcriptional regulator [Gammaproteobacteria bacterium]|nr:MerR family transcriptional regulator [Gammaproteobacteria bacterium]